MNQDLFAIVLDRATTDELNAVHEIVKANSPEWWHQFTSVWLVFGKSAGEWSRLVLPSLVSPASSCIVLRVAPSDQEHAVWSSVTPKAEADKVVEWLKAKI